MNATECKKVIIEMLERLDGTDIIFLRQIYTLLIKHIERKRGR